MTQLCISNREDPFAVWRNWGVDPWGSECGTVPREWRENPLREDGGDGMVFCAVGFPLRGIMRDDGFQECIVTVIDLIGVKAVAGSGKGSSLMVAMHQRVTAKANAGHLPSHAYIYLWNDSILLLAYL